MTNEEKQALNEGCKQRVDALNTYCRVNPDDSEAALDLSLCKIALAALTAQPIKLPPRRSMLTREDIEHDYVTCMAISVEDAIAAIREAGYEVQE